MNTLELGPRKKVSSTDPLVHHGQHFGRTIQAFCHIQALLTNGLIHNMDILDDKALVPLSIEERNEHDIFKQLLQMVPSLQEQLFSGTEEDVMCIAELIQRGTNSARSDDTKGLKGAVLDWIVLRGQNLNPTLSRNIKINCGFHHECTGVLLCPTGLDWNDKELKDQL